MDWKEIKEKSEILQAQGKTEKEAAEILRDEIGVFAKGCVEHPEKLMEAMHDFSGAMQNNPSMTNFLCFLLFRSRSGWGW